MADSGRAGCWMLGGNPACRRSGLIPAVSPAQNSSANPAPSRALRDTIVHGRGRTECRDQLRTLRAAAEQLKQRK